MYSGCSEIAGGAPRRAAMNTQKKISSAVAPSGDPAAYNAIDLQLGLLQAFLPADAWLVGCVIQNDASIIAQCGVVNSQAAMRHLVAPSAAATALHQGPNWGPPQFSSFEAVDADILGEPGPCHIIRAPLHLALAGEISAAVLGFASEESVSRIQIDAHRREVSLCLQAIEQTLTMRFALLAAEDRMRETQRSAHIDALTQILNRNGWNHHLRALAKAEADVAILFIDLDFLKQVNDTRGHIMGDQILQLTAQCISSVLRSEDRVARIGGDEFAIALSNISKADAQALKSRLSLALSEFGIEASIGVAFRSEQGCVHTAMQLADARMYAEKRGKHEARARLASV